MKMHPRKPIALIAALDEENAIGRNGDLLCYLPNDLKHFKQITQPQGHGAQDLRVAAQGALPNRTNIVITSDQAENYPVASWSARWKGHSIIALKMKRHL